MNPQKFESSLQALDPLLSLRWGASIHQYVVERRALIPRDEVEYLEKKKRGLAEALKTETDPEERKAIAYEFQQVDEEIICAKHGKRVIIYAKELGRHIFDALCASDIQRYGGYSRFADELEKREMKRDAERSRQRSDYFRALNRETYSILDFIHRKSETALLNGEKDLNVLLHGRKRDADPVPTR